MAETRRRFLEVTGHAAACAVLSGLSVACASETGAAPAKGPVAAGNVKDTAPGTLRFVPGQPLIIGRDAGGIYAMTAICTHQQCDMTASGSIDANGLSCNCHGSRFDKAGAPTGGPARTALEHYKISLAPDGGITVLAGDVVPAAERVSVPG